MGLNASDNTATEFDPLAGGVKPERIASSEETTPIMACFGTCKYAPRWMTGVKNLKTEKVETKTGKDSYTTTGHKYWGDLIANFGMGPFHKLKSVWINDGLNWSAGITNPGPSAQYSSFALNHSLGSVFVQWGNPNQGFIKDLWGYRSNEPHLVGSVFGQQFYINESFNRQVFPNHRGSYYMQGVIAYRQLYFGLSNSVPNIEIVATRRPMMGLYNDDIGDSANPARIIQELRSNPLFGEGYDDDFDESLLDAQAARFKAEGFGLNVLLTSREDADKVYKKILGYFGGSVCRNMATGLLEIKDYFTPPQQTDVKYVIPKEHLKDIKFDPDEGNTYQATQLIFQDQTQDFKEQDVWHYGAMSFDNEAKTHAINVLKRPWIGTQQVAGQVCSTAGNLAEIPKVSGSATILSQSANQIDIGDWVEIPHSVIKEDTNRHLVRILRMSKSRSNAAEWDIDFEEDRITLSNMTGYEETEVTLEDDEEVAVDAFVSDSIIELPRPLTLDKNFRMASLVGRNSSNHVGYRVIISTDGGSSWRSRGDYEDFALPVVVGPGGIGDSDTTFSVIAPLFGLDTVESVSTADADADRLLLIMNGEIMSIQDMTVGLAFGTIQKTIETDTGSVAKNITPTTFTFENARRGRFDTSSIGFDEDQVGFLVKREWIESNSWIDDYLTNGVNLRVKHLPLFASGGVLDSADAVTRQVSLVERYKRPVPHDNLQSSTGDFWYANTDMALTWQRTDWTSKGYPYYDFGAQEKYSFIEVVLGSTVRDTITISNPTTLNYTYTWAMFEAEFGTNPSNWPSEVKFRVYSVVDGLKSFNYDEISLNKYVVRFHDGEGNLFHDGSGNYFHDGTVT